MISFDRVDSLLLYDLNTGKLYWKVSLNRKIKVGSEAGSLNSSGHIQVQIDGNRYQAHRVAHLLMTGHWPDGNPEHENRIGSDNRWENIKDLVPDQSHNMGNKSFQRNNTSGMKGVSWQRGKWFVLIEVRAIGVNLGRFDDLREAGLTYDAAAKL